MFSMQQEDILRVTSATPIVVGEKSVAGPVVIDSRQVEEGATFVAFAGEQVDGNAYAAGAFESGAALVVVSSEPAPEAVEAARAANATLVRAEADDCEEFLLRLSGEWRRRHEDWLVVGVTGSVGKTTTKDMLAYGIAASRRTHATAGNFNNLIGLPLTLLSAPEDSEVVVCELGMNHFHEIDRLVAACVPALAVITNVGTSHIGLLGSRENIARAKAEVTTCMRAHEGVGPALALTSSGDFTGFIADGFARPAGIDVMLVGTGAADDVRAQDVTLTDDGCAHFTLVFSDGWSSEVTLSIPGRKVVDDFLLAMAVVYRAGLDRSAAIAAIEQMPASKMRLDVRQAPCGARIIDDSYNAAPASMASSLDVLCSMSCEGRRIAVLGEIGELGAEEVRLHGYVGAYAAAKPLDLLVLVGGELAGHMAEAARSMGFSEDLLVCVPSVEDAIATIVPVLGQGDLVLVKASRSAGLDQFVKEALQ